ncbi:uncharacterized protein DEA37_0008779 [Paragonimus westermani]|uniref:Cell morphogenesis protein N-terminal domain-containing protein n=1 Tax=Paragonimus westermani TaxID=34504 RepID=A0A5J4P2S8_9TREM|nr:uncharacterized protein DEA37_0008779 [Paragonimus westermani]
MSAQKPGELVICTLLKQFTILAKSKIEKALEEKQENNLVKSMRLSEDVAFEQLLEALHICAEFALPSLVRTLVQWYQSQHSSGSQYSTYLKRAQLSKDCKPVGDLMTHSCFVGGSDPDGSHPSQTHYILHPSLPISKLDKAVKINSEGGIVLKSFCLTATEARVLAERRDLAIDVVFCQTLLSILRQLSYHPGHNDKIELILEQSFRRFKCREDAFDVHGLGRPDPRIGISSKSKMHPIEDFVNCFTFLQELGQYFLEVKEPEIKHVLSDLFVEILLPVAAVARQEVNIPALKQFVESLYPTSLELASKKKHVPVSTFLLNDLFQPCVYRVSFHIILALFPLVTCLLCVGTKSFFLSNWANFLNICLSQLKNRNPKIALVSLQSLSCLLWVYIVRIRGEKHTETQSKLHHIVNSIFPKHQKFVVPKDAPMNIFVRIIQFIAHEKLEFAVKEIIIDRLGVSGLQKNLYMPERMNIGLCAFLLVAHGLQQKEGAPPMPQQSTGGCGLRQTVLKRSFHGTNLNDALGHILGIQNYLVPIRRAFEMILRQLDIQVCRNMMLSKQEISQKEFEELMTAERKPKMDLLKTCVACIPRLLPNDMTKPELLEFLAKVCLHVDEDVRKMAQQAMANLIVELPAFRVKTIQVFIQFIQKYVPDTSSHQLDSCLKTLFHLLNNWNLALQKDGAVSPNVTEKAVLYEAEGFALVMLCHCRTIARRLALHILRKCRSLLNQINLAKSDPLTRHNRSPHELCCIDVLDRCVPIMLRRVLPLLPPNERHGLLNVANLDFAALADRGSPVWLGGTVPVYPCPPMVLPTHVVSPQHSCLIPVGGVSSASTAIEHPPPKDACDVSKKVACTGQYSLFPEGSPLDTAARFSDEHHQSGRAQIAENRASSLLRSSSKKPTTERDQLIPLWHNYATLGCCIAPSSTGSRVLKPQSRDYLLDFDCTQRPAPLIGTVQTPNSNFSQTLGPSTESSTNTPSTTTVSTSRPTQPQPVSSDSKCPVPVLKETARDLVKLLVPFFRCEQQDIRDSAVGAIGRINPAAFRDALEELHPLLKESVDRKQENVRRRRRRDGLRSSLIRVLALMSQGGLFAYPESNALTAQGYLIPQLTDYLDGMRVYLDSVADQATNPACIGSNAAVSNQLSIVTSSPSVGGSSTGSLLVGNAGTATPVVTSYSATTVNTSVSLAATSYQNVISTDSYVLMEIRLNFCIFVLELVRQLPKEKRDQLLPTMMRHQLFLLISRWSGFYDNVMGVSLSETEAAYPSFLGASRQNLYRLSRSSVLNSGLSPIAANQPNANDGASLNSLSLDPGQSNLEVVTPSNPSTSAGSGLSTVDTNAAQVAPLVSITLPGSVPDLLGAQPDSWELRLWTDLIWTANQAMGALACCGPIYDQQALFGDPGDLLGAERSVGIEKPSVPAAGYILRWVASLLVARDPALCVSPWLWHCPITDAPLKYAPMTHSGSCGGLTFGTQPRLTFVGVDRRMDTLLRQLGEETLVLLLDINQASSGLLNWAIDQCFTATNVSLSTACFFSISRILENFPDFACDFVCLLILSFAFLDHPHKAVSNRAFYLLRVIYHRFIIKPSALIHGRLHSRETNFSPFGIGPEASDSPTSDSSSHVCAEFSANFQFWKSMSSWAPTEVVRQFAAQHPDLTLSVFSEITKRMESCREALRTPLLRLLIPWIINVELVDLIGDVSPNTQAVTGKTKKNVTSRVMPSGSCARRLFTDEIVHAEEDDVTEGEVDDDDVEEEGEEEDSCEVEGQDEITLQESNFNRSPFFIDRHSVDSRFSASKRARPRPESLVVLGSAPSDADSEYEGASGIKSFPAPYTRTRKADSVPLTRPALNRISRSSYISGGYRNKSAVAPPRSGVYDQFWSTVPPTLRTSGWGSKQSKRIITYLASEDAGSVVEELVIEMQTIDGIGLIVERIGYLPFFRITTAASVARANGELETNPSNPTPTGTLAEKSTIECEQSFRVPADPSAMDSSPSHQTLLQSVNPDEHLEQIDSELVAIGLERERLAVLKRKKLTHSRAIAFPFGGSQRRSTIEVSTETKSQPPNRRPKSATCQPSTGSDDVRACSQQIIGDSPTSLPKTLDNNFVITNIDSIAPIPSNQTEPELDVDSFDSRQYCHLNTEDKYGTLRAKDFSRLLSVTDAHESEEASDLDPIPTCSDYQARCGTLPMTADSRERYYSRTLPDAVLRSSPGQCTSQPETSTQLPPSQQSSHSKRVKPKTRTHPRPADPTKFVLQTVSLPPSLARLAPLPLSLPMGVPSLPSLWLSSTTGRTDNITSDSPQGATSVPRVITGQSGTRQSATVLQSKLSTITSQGSLLGKPHLQPLAMPPGGCYQAPLGAWLSEPLVIGGSVVYTGSWPASGARSPLVLLLAGELTQSPTIRIDWNPYLPVMLLCTFLGIDHCRALVQEECKQLLVSLLSLTCPKQESLALLRLELEDCLVSCAYPSAFPGPRLPKYRLTVDGGPCREKFTHLPSVDFPANCNFSAQTKRPERHTVSKQVCDQSLAHRPAPNTTFASDSVLVGIQTRCGSPPLTLFPSSCTQDVDKSRWNGSSYSLLSTDTLIPGQDDIGLSTRGPIDCIPRGKPKDESSHLQSAFPSKKTRLKPPKLIPPKPLRHSFRPVHSSAPAADPLLFKPFESDKVNSKLLNESVEELRDVLISRQASILF